MKESYGGLGIAIIVVVLILIFAGLMTTTISRSNAIAVKDQILRVINEYGSFDFTHVSSPSTDCDGNEALCKMVDILAQYSYRQEGKCPDLSGEPDAEVIGYQRNGVTSSSSGNAAFCIVRRPAGGTNRDFNFYYYEVILFYGIDMPVIRSMFRFTAVGETPLLSK